MSVKEELVFLEQEQSSLREKLENIESTLDSLCTQRDALGEKVKTLEARKSTLAKELAEECRNELLKLEENIDQVQKERDTLKQKLDEGLRKIAERKNHTALYIQEQVERMVPEVLEYIQKHSKEIGHSIKRKFRIVEKVRCDIPVISIFDDKVQITATTDYYFREECNVSWGIGYVTAEKTAWYSKYCNDFQNAFNKKLAESWTYKEIFDLTIEETTFTLELV